MDFGIRIPGRQGFYSPAEGESLFYITHVKIYYLDIELKDKTAAPGGY
jgi:hypothetical protein